MKKLCFRHDHLEPYIDSDRPNFRRRCMPSSTKLCPREDWIVATYRHRYISLNDTLMTSWGSLIVGGQFDQARALPSQFDMINSMYGECIESSQSTCHRPTRLIPTDSMDDVNGKSIIKWLKMEVKRYTLWKENTTINHVYIGIGTIYNIGIYKSGKGHIERLHTTNIPYWF